MEPVVAVLLVVQLVALVGVGGGCTYLGWLAWGKPADERIARAEADRDEAEARAEAAEKRADERLANAASDLSRRVDLELAVESGDLDRLLLLAPSEDGISTGGPGGESDSRAATEVEHPSTHG